MIWKVLPTLEQLNAPHENTILAALGIQFVKIGEDFLEATMPVDERTRQPEGLLHGGASVVLAESLGSVASVLVVGSREQSCVGIEVSAAHVGSMKEGVVLGRVTPIRLGKSIHVWEIKIVDQSSPDRREICRSRLTVMVRSQPPLK